MAPPMDLRGRWIVITGASAGLGMEMARYLARAHKAHLVLVARRAERLNALRDELVRDHGVEVATITADLSVPADVERVFADSTRDRAVYGVILNAGVTHFGLCLEQSFEGFEQLLATNVTSVARLVWRFVPYLRAKSEGGVMLVSSMAGMQPMPFQAAYGGTKAFLNSFGVALAEELRGTPVSITVFAPGGIATEMLHSSGIDRKFKKGDPAIMDADACARLAVEAFRRREPLYVPGMLNKLSNLFQRFGSRAFVASRVAALYRGALPPG